MGANGYCRPPEPTLPARRENVPGHPPPSPFATHNSPHSVEASPAMHGRLLIAGDVQAQVPPPKPRPPGVGGGSVQRCPRTAPDTWFLPIPDGRRQSARQGRRTPPFPTTRSLRKPGHRRCKPDELFGIDAPSGRTKLPWGPASYTAPLNRRFRPAGKMQRDAQARLRSLPQQPPFPFRPFSSLSSFPSSKCLQSAVCSLARACPTPRL